MYTMHIDYNPRSRGTDSAKKNIGLSNKTLFVFCLNSSNIFRIMFNPFLCISNQLYCRLLLCVHTDLEIFIKDKNKVIGNDCSQMDCQYRSGIEDGTKMPQWPSKASGSLVAGPGVSTNSERWLGERWLGPWHLKTRKLWAVSSSSATCGRQLI
jgi:hypothetical protein